MAMGLGMEKGIGNGNGNGNGNRKRRLGRPFDECEWTVKDWEAIKHKLSASPGQGKRHEKHGNTTDNGHRICFEFFQPSQIKRVAHNEAMHNKALQDLRIGFINVASRSLKKLPVEALSLSFSQVNKIYAKLSVTTKLETEILFEMSWIVEFHFLSAWSALPKSFLPVIRNYFINNFNWKSLDLSFLSSAVLCCTFS